MSKSEISEVYIVVVGFIILAIVMGIFVYSVFRIPEPKVEMPTPVTKSSPTIVPQVFPCNLKTDCKG